MRTHAPSADPTLATVASKKKNALTPYDLTLVPVLDVLCPWGRQHLKRDPAT